MTEKKDLTKNDLNIELSEQVKAAMAADPALAAALREIFANMRQAHQAVEEGKYASMEDAMEAITGHRPVPFDEDDIGAID